MDIAEQLQKLQGAMMEHVLEPERVECFLYYLNRAGFPAEIDWLPEKMMDAHAGSGRCHMGTIRLSDSPIARIELHKASGNVRRRHPNARYPGFSSQRTRYIDHVLVDEVRQGTHPNDLQAVRKEKRKFWIAGPITGYTWSGGRLAAQLQTDEALNRVLAETGERRIYIHLDPKNDLVRMTRPHSARAITGIDVPAAGVRVALPDVFRGMLDHPEEAAREFNFPSPTALKAYERIAAHIRQVA